MKKTPLYTPVFSLTLLLSAGLLFSVQPMFSKMILPLLGGTPQVWNTAMLFFQVMLLGGYAYAHGTSKYLSVRTQGIAHLILLSVFIFALPFGIPDGWAPPVERDPTLWQLSLMAITVGGPFFILAASAPMLQRWFAGTKDKDAGNPYFLYGASNLGSMAALFAYPTIIEPLLTLNAQSYVWMGGYIGLFICMLFCTFLAWDQTKKPAHGKTKDKPVSWAQRGLWLMLSFIPSSLMLGVTTFITTDVAAVPLLWVIPLAMYVGTFIIVFARKPLISREYLLSLQGALFILLLAVMVSKHFINPMHSILLHLVLFFTCALACHMELAAAKPGPKKLTEFYLIMSLGGALGGFFNAIIAPIFFIIPIEYALALFAAICMRYPTDQDFKSFIRGFRKIWKARGLDGLFSVPFIAGFIAIFAAAFSYSIHHMTISLVCAVLLGIALLMLQNRRWLFAVLSCFVLLLFPPGYVSGNDLFINTIHRDRNFFGVVKVTDTKDGERILLHGTTNHGAQALDPKYRLMPLSYYSHFSPINDAFNWLNRKDGPQKVGVIGLGIGVTACFQKQGRSFDFFEIDPVVVDIAENKDYFTYLSDCKSPYKIIMGDGRLTMKEQPDHSYDMILLDAFSSDNIPAHLLTIEAIELYLKKLKPDGILIANISNKYLDIEPVMAQAAQKLRISGYARVTSDGKILGTSYSYYPTHFFSMSENARYIQHLQRQGWTPGSKRFGVKLWTDQYSNILSVLENYTGQKRIKKDMESQSRDE